MSGKEKEREKEEVILDHWRHQHPLTLVQTHTRGYCHGCPMTTMYVASGEEAYECSKKCGNDILLHEECAEMSRKIRHPMHPKHILIQREMNQGFVFQFSLPNSCEICEGFIWKIGYYCTRRRCAFKIHVGCALDRGVVDATDDDGEQSRGVIEHPSHPQHELRLWRRRSSFKCDACGTKQVGDSYLCSVCQYWIHRRCASLPDSIEREDHPHSLSLSFCVPHEYIRFRYKCDVCHETFQFKYWIYHCQLCRYAVHIKCAFKKYSPQTNNDASNGKGIIRFPITDVAEEQIRAFVMRGGGANAIASIPDDDDDEIVNVKYEFCNHKHQLSLISSSSSHYSQEEDHSDDDGDEDDYGEKSKLICDGCTTPIFQKKQIRSSASSSSDYKYYYYMSCGKCKYLLHMACFHLPPRLPSLPLHQKPDHELLLQSCPKLEFGKLCSVCDHPMNGLFYACTKCSFKADIKCASLPNTIYHATHPQHPLKHLSREGVEIATKKHNYLWLSCAAHCCYYFGGDYRYYSAAGSDCYVCDICEFMLHVPCALLPASVTDRRWDKQHALPLTFDANVNHPGEFYCDHCEKQMNPKRWMYHCRCCDLSFHPYCFPSTAGYYRNIKFGREYVIPAAHPHPLTYQLLITKRRCCDVCHKNSYSDPGFHCASCNFIICFRDCASKMLRDGDIQAVDD